MAPTVSAITSAKLSAPMLMPVAVMVPALKLPLASLDTMVLAVLALVLVMVAELACPAIVDATNVLLVPKVQAPII